MYLLILFSGVVLVSSLHLCHFRYDFVSLSTLTSYHPGCNSLGASQTPNCFAAIHRYCSAVHPSGSTPVGGISQQVSSTDFLMGCMSFAWYGSVPLATMTSLHPGCNGIDQSQTPN